jgi:sec-independent protein translocase protein TatA
MLPNLGFGELIIILILALLLFGSKRLPEVAKGIGKSFKMFKKALKNFEG